VIASLPAHDRLARSSKHPFNRSYFLRITRCISARRRKDSFRINWFQEKVYALVVCT